MCFYAFVAMGSTRVKPFISKIKNQKKWFEEQILRKAKRLKNEWENQEESVSRQMLDFLNENINFLEDE